MFMEVALNVVRKPDDPAVEINRLYNYAGQTPSLPLARSVALHAFVGQRQGSSGITAPACGTRRPRVLRGISLRKSVS